MRSLVTVQIVLLSAVFALAGCDDFVLAEQYQLTIAPLAISAETTVIAQGETILLELRGGTPPYHLFTSHNLCRGGDAGHVTHQTPGSPTAFYTASNSIGPVFLILSDSSNESAVLTITIRPAAPIGLTATPGSRKITLSWDGYHHPDSIQQLRIDGRRAGDPFEPVLLLTPATTEAVHDDLNPNATWDYRMYATACDGEYESAATPVATATAQP
jgi:hypothetical protein